MNTEDEEQVEKSKEISFSFLFWMFLLICVDTLSPSKGSH